MTPLVNLVSGVVLPEQTATRLIIAVDIGQEQADLFVEERLN